MELTKPSGLVSQSVRPYVPPWCRHLPLRCRHRCRHPHWVSTPSLCRCRHQCQHQHFSGISVLSTYSYHPFISTTIYPKILSNLLNLSCYIELLNLSGFIFTIRGNFGLNFYLWGNMLKSLEDISCLQYGRPDISFQFR